MVTVPGVCSGVPSLRGMSLSMADTQATPCDRCPCPDTCLRKPAYSAMMAKGPRNPVEERCVINAAA